MDTVTSFESREQHDVNAAEAAQSPALRAWPAVVLTIAFWVFLYANHNFELSASVRFISRMLGFAIAFLAFLGWWLSRSKILWRDRLLAIAGTIGFGAIALQFADKTINWFALLLCSFPYIMTVWTGWILVSRSLTHKVQRIGFCLAMVLIFSYFALLRWDGLDALQRAEMSWRWTTTSEKLHLASLTKNEKDSGKLAAVAKKWILQPGDCPEYRGPHRDGVVPGETLAADWTKHPPKPLWRKRVGPGWSGMIVVDGHLVTQEQRGEVEAVVCYDAATGDELWAHNDNVRFEEALAGAGPRGTPTFADGRIYALGAKGVLNCLVAELGDVVWSRNIVKDAGVAPSDMPQWGYSVSPLVVDGLVIVFAGGAEKSILAYRADDGKLAWTRPGGKQSYSSPQLAAFNGQKQVVMHDTTAIRVLNIADGAEQWNYPNGSEISLPMVQPHIIGSTDMVVSITPGMARLEVPRQLPIGDGRAPRWETNKLRPDFSDFVIHKDRIYGLNDGVLCCLDLATGHSIWKKSRPGHGQILLLPDQDALLVSNDTGEIILVAVNDDGPKELGRFQAIEGKTWNGPVLVGNHVYLRNAAEMAAYEINVQNSMPKGPASDQPSNPI